ncbi:hypothetical protein AWB81_04208 [Caballeronia arationis]|uniref:hypothetical protein n=1 Tax=Caballeronia arationis TaxID=1777142 RepID=UPI00074C56B2|nr:hypothetical protein [Caballeronia arationis]SAK83432.1 hypothetical protein AWB81_04208 [Caballeronia arationis]
MLHPEKKGLFGALSKRLKGQLDTLRHMGSDTPMAVFSGRGPIARKLRDHVNAQRFFEIVDSPFDVHPDFNKLERKIEKYFNFHPTTDEAMLDELAAFVKFTFPLMSGAALEGQEFADMPVEAHLTETESGFYVDRRGLVPLHLMLLRARVSEHGPDVLFILPNGEQDEKLMLYHPGEDALYPSDFSFTFPGLVEKLKEELAKLLDPLGLSLEPVNLAVYEETMHDMVRAIFDNEEHIKPSQHGVYFRSDEWSRITIPLGAGYSWMFTNTRGQYPSRSAAFVRSVGGTLQSTSIASLNELSRQGMFKFVFAELEKVVGLIGAAEVSEAA